MNNIYHLFGRMSESTQGPLYHVHVDLCWVIYPPNLPGIIFQGLRRVHVTPSKIRDCNVDNLILYLVTLDGSAPRLTVDSVTIFRHSLNFAI